MKNYTVYKHISPNGKIYIGITSKEPIKRWNGGSGYLNSDHNSNFLININILGQNIDNAQDVVYFIIGL